MRPALPALLLVGMLLTTGCVGVFQSPPPPSDQRALDALNRSRAAVDDVTSYRLTLDAHAEAAKGDEEVSVDVTADGVVDVRGRRLNVTTRANDDARESYLEGYTAYRECARIGWDRENLSRSVSWIDYTPLGWQLALMERTNVYWRGTETVDGREAAVLVAYPTKEELRSVPDARGVEATDLEGANLKNVTVTLWIDVETDRPLKARRYVKLKRGGATAEATMTIRFTDYDKPVNVARPPSDDEETFWKSSCPGS